MDQQEVATDVVVIDSSSFVSEARPALFVLSQGGQFGKCYPLNEPTLSLGRASDCSIQIDQRGVSRKHCTLTVQDDGKVRLQDAGSTNGTWLGGRWLSPGESVLLEDGVHICCGGVLLKFVAQGSSDHPFLLELHRRACFDALTGLFNRGHFHVLGEMCFRRAKRHDQPLSLLLLDFDHFKRVNDRFGHLCGDYVLRETAELMQRCLRGEDVVGRWGGEEFAVLLPETQLLGASILAHVLRTTVERHCFQYRNASIRVTISIGVTSLHEHQISLAQLFAAGDEQLLRAKRRGRNCVCAAGAGEGWETASPVACGLQIPSAIGDVRESEQPLF